MRYKDLDHCKIVHGIKVYGIQIFLGLLCSFVHLTNQEAGRKLLTPWSQPLPTSSLLGIGNQNLTRLNSSFFPRAISLLNNWPAPPSPLHFSTTPHDIYIACLLFVCLYIVYCLCFNVHRLLYNSMVIYNVYNILQHTDSVQQIVYYRQILYNTDIWDLLYIIPIVL